MYAAQSTDPRIIRWHAIQSNDPRIMQWYAIQSTPKRKRAVTASTEKPVAKKPASLRNQPSSATPLTTRARAKIGEPSDPRDHALNNPNQMTMSQFEPFAALAHRHTSAVEQQAQKRSEKQPVAVQAKTKQAKAKNTRVLSVLHRYPSCISCNYCA